MTEKLSALDRLLTYGSRESDGRNEGTLFLFADNRHFFWADSDVLALRSSVKTVGVKPLEWEEYVVPPMQWASADYFIGADSIGRHWAHHRIAGDLRGSDGRIVFHPTSNLAKAAAQADYERRILSTIEAPAAASEVTVPREFIEFVRTAPVSSGVCCCGDDMDKHPDPMSCGHSPTDQWDYSLQLWLEQIGYKAPTQQDANFSASPLTAALKGDR